MLVSRPSEPLRARAERSSLFHTGGPDAATPLPNPPHKGGGSRERRNAARSSAIVICDNATLLANHALSFPPPLWGRGREGGSHAHCVLGLPTRSLTAFWRRAGARPG